MSVSSFSAGEGSDRASDISAGVVEIGVDETVEEDERVDSESRG